MTDQAKTIFAENVLATLATVNVDGSPWSTPVHVATDGQYVYWFSKESTVHSQNIARDARVSLTLFSPDESRGPKGVYLNGVVEQLGKDSEQIAHDVMSERLGGFPPAFAAAKAYRLAAGAYSDEKSTGNCWYFYS